MSVTIYDIAQRASVSIATVSRALNNSARVADATRKRVFQVADELNYQPHASAQSLARNNSRLVSAVMPTMANYFYVEVLRGIYDTMQDSDYDLLVYAANSVAKFELQLQRALQKGRSDGLLIFSIALPDVLVERIKASGYPAVLVDAFHSDFDSVSVDNRQGGYLATRHLLSLGMRRVALIAASPDSTPARDRRLGYEKALQEAGSKLDENLIVSSGDDRNDGFSEGAGKAAMKLLLKRKPYPEGVFVVSDIQALGALRAIEEAGLKPGEDIAVVGFDDIEISEYVGLTTLRQPMYEIGRLAIEKILLRMAEPNRATSHTVFAPSLVFRDTCGQLPAQPPTEASPA